MKNLLHIGSGIVITIAIAIVLIILYQELYPPKIITFPQQYAKLDKKEYRPGDTVRMEVSYCKTKDLIGEHTIELSDDVILPVYSVRRALPIGCHTATYLIALVAVVPANSYHLTLTIQDDVPYPLFYGKPQTYSIQSEQFNVVKE